MRAAQARKPPCWAVEQDEPERRSRRIHRARLVLWRPEHRPNLAFPVEAGAGEPLGIAVPGAPGFLGRIVAAKPRSATSASPSAHLVGRDEEERSSDSRCERLH